MRHEGCRAACQSAMYTNRTRPQSRSFSAASIATASGTAHKRSCESGTPQRFLRRRRHVLVSSAVPPSSSPPRRRGLPHDPRQPAPWAPRGRFPRGRQRFLVGASAAQRDPPRSDTTHPIRRLVCLIPHFRGGGRTDGAADRSYSRIGPTKRSNNPTVVTRLCQGVEPSDQSCPESWVWRGHLLVAPPRALRGAPRTAAALFRGAGATQMPPGACACAPACATGRNCALRAPNAPSQGRTARACGRRGSTRRP